MCSSLRERFSSTTTKEEQFNFVFLYPALIAEECSNLASGNMSLEENYARPEARSLTGIEPHKRHLRTRFTFPAFLTTAHSLKQLPAVGYTPNMQDKQRQSSALYLFPNP
jgi:hypothetical protein